MKRKMELYKINKFLDVSSLTYYSRPFNVIVEWDGGTKYCFFVNNSEGKLIEYKSQRTDSWDRIVGIFNELVDKYIFDYDNLLSKKVRINQDKGRYNFASSPLLRA